MRALIFTFVIFIATAFPAYAQEKFIPITAFKTPAGISVWLVEDHTMPVLSVSLAFQGAGARNDAPVKQGLMRLLSNTLDEGAGERDSQQFQKLLADESISFSFSSSKDDFLASLYMTSDRTDLAFTLLADALTTPRFDPEPLTRMIEANRARIRSDMADPEWIAARLMNDVYFGSHVYGMNSGGTLNSLAALTAEDLKTAKNSFLARNNLLVAITGDITPEKAKALIDTSFKNLPEKPGLTSKSENFSGPAKPLIYHYAKDIPQSVILMQAPGIDRADPDFYAAQVANMIFGAGGFGSRLTEEIREKRGLTYGIYSSLSDMALADTLSISVSTENAQVPNVLELIKIEIQKMSSTPVLPKELADAKSYMVGSMPLALTSSKEISGLLLSQMLDVQPVDDLDMRATKINAVTIEDISRVSKRLFSPDRFTTVIVGPQPKLASPLQTIATLPNVE